MYTDKQTVESNSTVILYIIKCDDHKGVISGRTLKKDRQEEFEDTKGIITGRTPKKNKQEEFEDTKGVITPQKE